MKYYSEEKLLHSAQSLFEALDSRVELAQELAEYTYDTDKIAEGKALFEAAKAQQQTNQKETKEEIQAYDKFSKAFAELVETYKTHRKKVKIVFKDEPATLKILALKGSMATEYIIMEEVKAGGDRQEIHETIRVHSMEASKQVKVEGKNNDLIERIMNDTSLKMDKSKIAEVLDPKNFIGFSPIQTEEFIKNEAQPILDKYKNLIGLQAELKV